MNSNTNYRWDRSVPIVYLILNWSAIVFELKSSLVYDLASLSLSNRCASIVSQCCTLVIFLPLFVLIHLHLLIYRLGSMQGNFWRNTMEPFFDARWIWVDIILYFSIGTRIVKSITVLVSTIKILIGNVYIAQEPITFSIKINKKERNVSFFPCTPCCQSRLLRMHRKYDSVFLFPC